MSVWRITGVPWVDGGTWGEFSVDLISPLLLFNVSYCKDGIIANNVKPSAPLGLPDGSLLLGVVCVAIGGPHGQPANQVNSAAGLARSTDGGLTWDLNATAPDFFTGALAAPQFIQWGPGMEGAPDNAAYVYAHFPCNEGRFMSFWSQNDGLLLGRAPTADVFNRSAWEFFVGSDGNGSAVWSPDHASAEFVFSYPGMTGQNIAAHNSALGRYVLASWSFYNSSAPSTSPCPPVSWFAPGYDYNLKTSQLTLYESPSMWGPWSVWMRVDAWNGEDAGYTPTLPTAWHAADGRSMWLVHSGAWSSYNLATVLLTYDVAANATAAPAHQA